MDQDNATSCQDNTNIIGKSVFLLTFDVCNVKRRDCFTIIYRKT